MGFYDGLPPQLYEIIDESVSAAGLVLWVLCIRYLAAEVMFARRSARKMCVAFGWAEAWHALMQLRLAVGFTVFLSGEVPAMAWRFLARFQLNTGLADPAWMSRGAWPVLPAIGSAVVVIGFACCARAIVPRSWGRYGYWATIGVTLAVLVFTQLPMVRDGSLFSPASWPVWMMR